METHKLKKQNDRTELFRRLNNPIEIYSFAIHLVRILAFSAVLLILPIHSKVSSDIYTKIMMNFERINLCKDFWGRSRVYRFIVA